MNLYESGEDYLERILMLKLRNGKVRSIDIAEDMNFSKASVSIGMKKLRENEYISFDDSDYITLTPKGEEVAKEIYERHLLLSDLLVKLGVDKKIAAQDACKIEHDLTPESFEAIKKYYNEKIK